MTPAAIKQALIDAELYNPATGKGNTPGIYEYALANGIKAAEIDIALNLSGVMTLWVEHNHPDSPLLIPDVGPDSMPPVIVTAIPPPIAVPPPSNNTLIIVAGIAAAVAFLA